ncbi:hypothetical protein G7Z17_g9842 [Cylindrodendrum hubeiense]|uniref:Uncharacterized protein n=1 Tax=Cylindrodendrum hubeiense TaxID=595255 RepID=A0A9P5LCY1_9HYPO|nr:hypothetical protein G7Z17_g9842 [Cylindrodendrum hubeiense]
MIRPRWLARAKALSPVATPRARLLSTTSTAAFNGFNRSGSNDDTQWAIPGRTAPKTATATTPTTATTTATTTTTTTFTPPKLSHPKPNDEFAQWRKPRAQSPAKLLPHELVSRRRAGREFSKNDGRQDHMLVVEGLSPSLRSSDFSRLAARDISDWSSGINEVHQERDPWTLDPLGTYRISFSSHAAATVYQAKLDRLFRLAQLKLRSKTGLWANSVPASLRSPAATPEDEVQVFTLAPGSYAPRGGRLNARFSRVKGKWPWQRLVDMLVRRSGFTVEPAVVLLHMHHSAISATDLQAFIDADGEVRHEPWATSKPYHLATTLHENQALFTRDNTRVALKDDHAFRQKLRNRFVIVCESPDVAWRFIRSWNQRTLTREVEGQTKRTVLTASFIEV